MPTSLPALTFVPGFITLLLLLNGPHFSPYCPFSASLIMCGLRTHNTTFSNNSQACAWRTLMKKTSKAKLRNIVGQRVRQARLKCNPTVSQDDLAGKLAVRGILLDRTAISRIENQSRYVMDYEAAAIAGALRVPIAWLFGESA